MKHFSHLEPTGWKERTNFQKVSSHLPRQALSHVHFFLKKKKIDTFNLFEVIKVHLRRSIIQNKMWNPNPNPKCVYCVGNLSPQKMPALCSPINLSHDPRALHHQPNLPLSLLPHHNHLPKRQVWLLVVIAISFLCT